MSTAFFFHLLACRVEKPNRIYANDPVVIAVDCKTFQLVFTTRVFDIVVPTSALTTQ